MKKIYEELKEYFESQGISQKEIAYKTEVTPAYVNKLLNGEKGFGKKTAAKWSNLFGLSESYLLTGEGEMLKSSKFTATKDNNGIPLIPTNAIGGALTGISDSYMDYEFERYIVPAFRGADFMIRVQGDSMMPKYMSGDIVACKRVTDRIWFQWGKTYVIDSKQGVLIKRIEPSDSEGNISLHSENVKYKPFDLPVEELNGVALVCGVIRVE